ncbi:MAG TPA: glycosyltransferase family 4 protein [Magnetospirillum sp.]|nr:glycosyltransferase family 4 protein [Magnetospirillum sp.]
MKTKTVALVSGQDWHFLSHRLELAKAAQQAGYEVIAVVPPGDRVDDIRAAGFRVETIPISRNLAAPWTDLAAVWRLARLCRRRHVALVHAFALKPVLVSALAAALPGGRPLVATISGMGYLFISDSAKARLLRGVLGRVLRLLLDRPRRRVIVQNQDDRAAAEMFTSAERIRLIRGSGVDPDSWTPSPEPEDGPPIAVLPARMLWDKGVGELVEAARLLKARHVPVRVVLAGDGDPANPRNIPRDQLEAWAAEGVVEWWGHQADMRAVWARAHIAVLPSYREGLPKALLEAAACGRPLITTDVPGCRELVEHDANGLLVPDRAAAPLADAIERLARSADDRRRLGAEARRRLETRFSARVVNAAILETYASIL